MSIIPGKGRKTAQKSAKQPHYIKTPIALLRDRTLSPTDKMVVQYLAWRQGINGSCWPGMRKIQKDLGPALSTIEVIIARVEKTPYIRITRDRKGRPNHYYVNLDPKQQKCTENRYTTVPKIGTELNKELTPAVALKAGGLTKVRPPTPLEKAEATLDRERTEYVQKKRRRKETDYGQAATG